MEAASMVSRSLSVFGAFTTQESTSGTVFLIVILIMVLMIESLLEFAEHYSKKIDCEVIRNNHLNTDLHSYYPL